MQLQRIPNNRTIQNLKVFLLQKNAKYCEKCKANDRSKEKLAAE